MINIELFKANEWDKKKFINKKFLKNIFLLVLTEIKKVKYFKNIEFSVNLINDNRIKILNNKFRNKNTKTNVLTFSLYNNIETIIKQTKKLPYINLGDVFFSLQTINEEALKQNKTFKNHFIHLLVHSYLHLLCYDHTNDKDRLKMEHLEIKILKLLSIPNPYIII